MEEVKNTAAYKVFKEELFNLGDYQSYINDISDIVQQYDMLSEELKCWIHYQNLETYIHVDFLIDC